jgi:hypothetical protein
MRAKQRPDLTVLVFENHAKDQQHDLDFARIESVIEDVRKRHPTVEFRTLAEVAQQTDRPL